MIGSTNGLENIMLSDTVVRYNQVMVCVIAQQILSTHIETEFTEHTIELQFSWKKKQHRDPLDVVTMLPFSYAKDYSFFCSINAPFPRLIFHCTHQFAVLLLETQTQFTHSKSPPFLYPPLHRLSLFYPYAFCCRNYEKLFPKC